MGILRLFQKATNIGFDEEEGILCAHLNFQCCNVGLGWVGGGLRGLDQ